MRYRQLTKWNSGLRIQHGIKLKITEMTISVELLNALARAIAQGLLSRLQGVDSSLSMIGVQRLSLPSVATFIDLQWKEIACVSWFAAHG